jgi:hypothetical protein
MTVYRVRGGARGAASVCLLAAAGLALTLPASAQKPTPAAAHGYPPGPHAKLPAAAAGKPAAQPTEKSVTTVPAPPANGPPPAAVPGPAASPRSVEVTNPDDSTINIHVSATPRPEEPPSNNWGVGVLGLALLAAAVFFGLRYARQRGMTVPDALKRLGVEMPQDGLAGAPPILKPAPPPLPPLPSLGDLPVAGPAPASVGAVAAAPPRTGIPRLVGLEGAVAGESFDLRGTFTVGREADNALALAQDTTVSRRHARFEGSGDAWSVADEGSSNGTFVNGRRVSGTQALQPGDVVQIGSSRLRFED